MPHAKASILFSRVRVVNFHRLVCPLREPGYAQVDRSALTGTVTNPSGNVLIATTVTAVMPATGLTEVVDETGFLVITTSISIGRREVKFASKKALNDQLGLTLSKKVRQRDFLIVENAVQPITL